MKSVFPTSSHPNLGVPCQEVPCYSISEADRCVELKLITIEHFTFDLISSFWDVHDMSYQYLKMNFQQKQDLKASNVHVYLEASIVFGGTVHESVQSSGRTVLMWAEWIRFKTSVSQRT
jgi:hypothetical protein